MFQVSLFHYKKVEYSCPCRININNLKYIKIICFFRYEEHLINIWLVLIQNYPEAVVLGNDLVILINTQQIVIHTCQLPSRFGSVVAHSDLDWEVLGLSPSHTKDLKNGTYCSSACAGHNELE